VLFYYGIESTGEGVQRRQRQSAKEVEK